MRDRDCPHCGDTIHRTHHCRAVIHREPPTPPPPHDELMRWAEQARLEQLAGESQLHVITDPLPLFAPLADVELVDPPAYLPNAHPSNRGGRA